MGESLSVVRIGESLLVRLGVYDDQSRGNVGVNFSVEPRFLAGAGPRRRRPDCPAGVRAGVAELARLGASSDAPRVTSPLPCRAAPWPGILRVCSGFAPGSSA